MAKGISGAELGGFWVVKHFKKKLEKKLEKPEDVGITCWFVEN